MIRLWLIFVVLSILIHLGISTWRNMKGKDRWALTKSIGYSIIVALLVVIFLTSIVILF
jgi:hypothetical protein